MSGSIWANILQHFTNYLCNVGPCLTDNVYEENNLYNALSTILGQHCITILSSKCCPNMSVTTLHKKTTCAILAQSTQTCFHRKTSCSFQCLVACILTSYNLTKQFWLFLFNAGLGVHLQHVGQGPTLTGAKSLEMNTHFL